MGSKIENKQKYLPADETAIFCRQVSLILEAGIPLYDGMETLAESVSDSSAKEEFLKISKAVTESGSLYQAVKQAGFFPEYMVNMINIGEETGKLDDVLKSLAIYYEREAGVKKSLKSAISYPLVLIGMMSAVVLFLVIRIMPVFQDIFKNLGSDMTATGKNIMNTATVAGYVILFIVLIVLVIVLAVVIINHLGYGEKLKEFAFKIPGLDKVSLKLSAAKFSSVLAMMLSSGYSLEKSLELAPTIVNDSAAKAQIKRCEELVKSGMNFPEALMEICLFSGLQNRMISVGFKAGQLDTVMNRLAKEYNEEVDDTIEKLVGVIEPTLVAIMSLIIGGILLSVMLPLANIMSQIG